MIALAFRQFDRCVFGEYLASAHDLATGRVIVAGYLLFAQLPRGRWITDLPGAFHDPPPSLAMLTDGFAPESAVMMVNAAAFVAALALLLGYRTRVASVATTATLVLLNSMIFATGKIDHDILVVLAPAVMASSGWGDTWSLDAAGGRVRHLDPRRQQPRWQLAWLALVIALAMATAGIVKGYTDWLNPSQSSAYGHALANTVLRDRHTWLGDLLLAMPASPIWELTDWATVAVETAGLIAVWRARWFRTWCAALAGFHLAVALQMDIWFASNLVAYGLFVPWGTIVGRRSRWLRVPAPVSILALSAVTVGLTAHAVLAWSSTAPLTGVATRAIVLAAVPVAIVAWIRTRRVRPSLVAPAQRDESQAGDAPARSDTPVRR